MHKNCTDTFCHRVLPEPALQCCREALYIISYHILSYHIISYHIISYHIISYHIISYHIISYHIISYRIVSYRIISYHIIISLIIISRTEHTRTSSGTIYIYRCILCISVQVRLAIDSGVDSTKAAFLVSFIAFGSITARPLFGKLIDQPRVNRLTALQLTLLSIGVSITLVPVATN